MKIIHIAQYSAPYKGNFIASLEELESQLRQQGHEMIYIFPEKCRETEWISSFMSNRGGYFVPSPCRKAGIFLDRTLLKQLEGIFKKEKPDIIHCHFDGYDEYAVKTNHIDARVVWHQHNHRTLMPDFWKKSYQKIMLFHQYGIVGRNADLIVMGSDMQEEIEIFGYRKKAFCLPNGISTERVHYVKKTVHSSPTVFFCFGGRANQKGLDILLHAARILIGKGYDFVIEITDGVDTKETIRDVFLNDTPKQIRIIPQSENVQQMFESCDYFISASRHETFSYAIAEAMLTGTPIISSKIDGVAWALAQESVLTFEPENIEELASIMEKTILREITISESALYKSSQFIQENYTVEKWAQKLIAYYDTLLKV